MKESLEALDVAGHHFREAVDLALVGEEKSEHAADVIGGERDARAGGRVAQPLHQNVGRRVQVLVKAGRAIELERGDARGHGDRIAGQGARLVDRAQAARAAP